MVAFKYMQSPVTSLKVKIKIDSMNCDHIFMGRLKKRLRGSAPPFLSEMLFNF